MKITMITLGSTGDVRPYMLLGRELHERGHEVTIAAFAPFQGMIEEAGMSFYPISGDVVDMMGRLLQPDAVGVRYLKEFEKGIRDIAPMLLDDLLHCAEGAEAIVCTFFGSMFYSIAEKYDIPCIQTQYFPMDPCKDMPISSAPFRKLGKWWNVLSYPLLEGVSSWLIVRSRLPHFPLRQGIDNAWMGTFGNVVGLGAGSVPFQTWYLHRRGLDVGPGVGLMTLQYVFHKTAVLLYATVLLLAGRPWMAAHSDGVLRYLPGAYAVVAGVIMGLIALCALPVVQRLARWLLHFLPDTGRWAERRESWLEQLDTLSTESRHLLADKPRCAAILGVHLVKLFLLFCLPWMGLRFMGLDTGLAFWQVQLLTSLTLFVSNALPNVAGMGSVETAFLLVYSSFLPDASSMSLLMFYRLASYYAVFAASAVGFGLTQRRLSRE